MVVIGDLNRGVSAAGCGNARIAAVLIGAGTAATVVCDSPARRGSTPGREAIQGVWR